MVTNQPITLLPEELLQDIFGFAEDLSMLKSCALTSTQFYRAFQGRRSAVMKSVFRNETIGRMFSNQAFNAVDKFVTNCSKRHQGDDVIFREALWPYFAKQIRHEDSLTWAKGLYRAYRNTNREEEAWEVARYVSTVLVLTSWSPTAAEKDFGKVMIEEYWNSGRKAEAIFFQEGIIKRLDDKDTQYQRWSKDLGEMYIAVGRTEDRIRLQEKLWVLLSGRRGPDSKLALEWARYLVFSYQEAGRTDDALDIHERVLISLDPTTSIYIAWARQLIHMQKRARRTQEALTTSRAVWNRLVPGQSLYFGWTRGLCDAYRAVSRDDDALEIEQSVWEEVNLQAARNANDTSTAFHLRCAGLALASTYRQRGEINKALDIKSKCGPQYLVDQSCIKNVSQIRELFTGVTLE